MKNPEQYDFSRPSPSGQPGFEILEIPDQQAWCFQGNYVNGKPVLFSQIYRSEESAQRGLKTALNLLRKKSGQVKETPDGWPIVLLAGNHQELARSLPFPVEGEGRKILQFFQRVAASPNPMVEVIPQPVAAPPAVVEEEEGEPIRYAFRLYFYTAGKDGPLTGRIEQVNNPAEKATFKGLDSAVIEAFLRSHLKEIKEEPAPVPAESTESKSTPKSAKTPQLPPISTLTVTKGQAKGGKSFDLILATAEPPGESAVENCTVSLRNMQSQQVTVLSNLHAERTAGGKFNIRLGTGQIPSGTYHLRASVWLKQQVEGTPKIAHRQIQGTGWLQLV